MVWSIILLGLLIIAAIIIFIVIKNIIKAVITVCIILFLVTGILALVLFFDSSSVRNNLINKPSTFLYSENGEIKAGFSIILNGQKTEYLDEDSLNQMNSFYETENLERMLGSDYKLFIVDSKIFGSVAEVDILNYTVPGPYIKDLIDLQDQETSIVELILSRFDLNNTERKILRDHILNETDTPEELKGKMFSWLLMEKVDSGKGTFSLISEYKKGNVIIYKESATFSFIKELPEAMVKGLFPAPKQA